MPVEVIAGGLHVDERGIVSFVNDFDFNGVDHFYTIAAHKVREPRGWIGHRRAHKWFTALAGSILLVDFAPEDWGNPSRDLAVQRFTLFALKPSTFSVPPGHATASNAF